MGPQHADNAAAPRRLAVAGLSLVAWAGLCKALLFRNLEYSESDLFSFLEMTWSWLYTGRFLHDNAYGDHTAIHGFYLLPALAPFTVPLGGYGFVLVLVALHSLAVLRTARATALDLAGRLAVLAGQLGPVAYFVFDNPGYGFHPELLYPPLAVLLALDLLESRLRRALLVAAVIALVKEDGVVLCAAVVVADLTRRLRALRGRPPSEYRKVLAAAFAALLGLGLVFAAGMRMLAVRSAAVHVLDDATSASRVGKSVRIVRLTVTGQASSFQEERLWLGLAQYAVLAGLVLLPLGRRIPRSVPAVVLAVPPALAVLVVSAAYYRFQMMMWGPRAAFLLAVLLACVIAGSAPPHGSFSRRAVWEAAVLAALSWGLQLLLLGQSGYLTWRRLDPVAMVAGNQYRVAELSPAELRLLRCVAARLPGGLPVTAPQVMWPVFHRQSVVFPDLPARQEPRLRIVQPVDAARLEDAGFCAGPREGRFAVELDCALQPVVVACDAS